MTLALEYQPLEGAPIQKIVLVDRICHEYLGPFRSDSLPGHLIHLVLSGEVEYQIGNRRQRLTPGTGVWHYENEAVKGTIVQSPWIFGSALFTGPLPPPPDSERVFPISARAVEAFDTLLEAWRDEAVPPMVRHLRTFSLLGQLLLEMLPESACHYRTDAATEVWWQLEARLREDLSQPIDLRRLEALARRSQRSIVRACRLAVGTSPMKRIKELRLSYARGLVHFSQLAFTDIALRVGYGRVQELSRDYHRRFGLTPREDRHLGPNYKQKPHE